MKFLRIIIISGEVLLVGLLLLGIVFKISGYIENKKEISYKEKTHINSYKNQEEHFTNCEIEFLL